VAEEKTGDANKLTNQVREGTGQFDARFMLWRTFCVENGVAVETLPSDLEGEVKDRWEKLKAEKLSPGSEKE
jgi:hypothetical protein